MPQSDLDYFRERARVEWERVESASSEEVALIHRHLAVGYEHLIERELRPKRPTLRIAFPGQERSVG